MVNSTYTVASDPNTMRDSGFLRNAQYTLIDRVEEQILKAGKTDKGKLS